VTTRDRGQSLVITEVVPSAAEGQWFLRTVGVFPNASDVASAVLLDNGDVWLSAWGKRWYPNNTFFGGYGQWIGKVTPEGCVQYSGNHWATDAADNGTFGAEGYGLDEWFLPNQRLQTGNTRRYPLLTDGTYIYFASYPMNPLAGSTYDGMRWWRLDPDTGYATWIAGGPLNGTYWYDDPIADSHDGRQAVIGEMYAWTIDENYIYWTQKTPSSVGDGLVIRRMNLNGNHPVTTLPGLDPSPSWWTTEADEATINSATGMPQRFNSDVWLKEHEDFTEDGGAMVLRNGWIYFANGPSLRRIPVDGGAVQTYLWGYSWDETTYPTDKRDNLLDFSETPFGSEQFNGDPARPGLGVPDLEGLDVYDGAALVGSKFFFVTQRSYPQIAYFDLDEMDAKYAVSGPRRINRVSPEHRTVVNGSWHTSRGSVYYPEFGSTIGAGSWRDASANPIIGIPGQLGLMANPRVPGWEQRVLVSHGELSELFWPAFVSAVVSYIEPMETGNVYNLNISFTGDLLKGYAAARDMEPPSAQEEVILG
jgi:hypothetical protein